MPLLSIRAHTSPVLSVVGQQLVPELEDDVGDADQIPFGFYVLKPSQEKCSDSSGLFDLSQDCFHILLAFRVGPFPRFRLELAQPSVHNRCVVENTPTRRCLTATNLRLAFTITSRLMYVIVPGREGNEKCGADS